MRVVRLSVFDQASIRRCLALGMVKMLSLYFFHPSFILFIYHYYFLLVPRIKEVKSSGLAQTTVVFPSLHKACVNSKLGCLFFNPKLQAGFC